MSGSEFKLFGDGLPGERIVSRFGLREGLSTPFRAEVEFSTLDASFDVSSLLGKSAALQIAGVQSDTRYVHGMIAQARFVRAVAKRLHFCLVLRPTLWGLSLREDCRIFLNQSLPDVVGTLLKEGGMDASAHWQLQGTFSPREFVVQYRETTLNFIQRLCEDAGIFYYFTHSEKGHELHLVDSLEALKNNPLVALTSTPMAGQGKSPIQQLSRKKSLRVSEVILRDFDFKNPTTFPEATAPLSAPTPLGVFDYPGKFDKAADGDALAKTRLRTERWDADYIELHCSRADLCVGGRVNIDGVDEEELSGEFAVTEAVYSGLAHQATEGRAAHYACHGQMQAVPLDSVYLPKRRALRPKITGVQTAVVVGDDNSDQSIFVDKYGRIRVHFHWDRRGPFNDTASCDVRVNQLPLGGSMILPRVGWEVLVAFEEGDPDRPLVMSRAYNAENMPPMALPASKASGSISSKSSPGGAGSNEISMGDSGGGQGFSMKAQKDLNFTTGYDQVEEVAVDDEHQVNANLSRSVTVDDALLVSGNQDETYGAHLSQKITGNQSVDIGGNATHNATANLLESVTSDRTIDIGGNQMVLNNGERHTITGQVTRKVGTLDLMISGSTLSHNIGATYSSKVGGVRVHLVKGGHSEVVKAAKTETIQAGAIHTTKGDFSCESQGAIAHMIGAVVQRKVTGDLSIKAPVVTLVGAKGTFKAGGAEMALSGGPIKLKGSSIVIKAAMIKITSGSLKLG